MDDYGDIVIGSKAQKHVVDRLQGPRLARKPRVAFQNGTADSESSGRLRLATAGGMACDGGQAGVQTRAGGRARGLLGPDAWERDGVCESASVSLSLFIYRGFTGLYLSSSCHLLSFSLFNLGWILLAKTNPSLSLFLTVLIETNTMTTKSAVLGFPRIGKCRHALRSPPPPPVGPRCLFMSRPPPSRPVTDFRV